MENNVFKSVCDAAPKEESNPKIRAAMDKILNIFETGNLEVVARAVFRAPPGSEIPSDKWSFMNRIFMMLACTEDARGFHQWKQAGRHVIKGARSFVIFGPLMKKVHDEKTGEERTVLYGFKTIPVFRIEDTNGEPVVRPSFEVKIPMCFDGIIAELDLKIKTMAYHEGAGYGYYCSSHRTIALATPEIKTFLHELSHAVDDRLTDGGLKPGQHIDQEVIAEFSAAVIGHMLGYQIPFGNLSDT